MLRHVKNLLVIAVCVFFIYEVCCSVGITAVVSTLIDKIKNGDFTFITDWFKSLFQSGFVNRVLAFFKNLADSIINTFSSPEVIK